MNRLSLLLVLCVTASAAAAGRRLLCRRCRDTRARCGETTNRRNATGQPDGSLMATHGPFPKRLAIGTSQFDQLRVLLATIFGSNPFYTAKFDSSGCNYKPRHLGQFTDAFPFTTKDEIVDLALFLSSDAAKFITGAVVVCDGGQSLAGLGVNMAAAMQPRT